MQCVESPFLVQHAITLVFNADSFVGYGWRWIGRQRNSRMQNEQLLKLVFFVVVVALSYLSASLFATHWVMLMLEFMENSFRFNYKTTLALNYVSDAGMESRIFGTSI